MDNATLRDWASSACCSRTMARSTAGDHSRWLGACPVHTAVRDVGDGGLMELFALWLGVVESSSKWNVTPHR